MGESTDRPQDVGRPHARRARGPAAPATAEVLERYRAAMRDELGDVLEELRPTVNDATPRAILLDGSLEPVKRPQLADRLRLWDLAIKLGRELGTGEDLDQAPPAVSPAAIGGAAPRLTARQRRALGVE